MTFELNIPEQISCKVIATSQDDLLIIKTLLESISGPDDLFDIEQRTKGADTRDNLEVKIINSEAGPIKVSGTEARKALKIDN